MPLYLINGRDKPGSSETRQATRSAHLEYARKIAENILVGGPILSEDGSQMVGSSFVIAFDNLEEAQSWAENDPYAQAGLFASTEVAEYKWLLGTQKPD